MNVLEVGAKAVARTFATARRLAWDDTDVTVTSRTIDGRAFWAVTTTERIETPTSWEAPLAAPYVDYLIDPESGLCVGIANERLIHWLPKSAQDDGS